MAIDFSEVEFEPEEEPLVSTSHTREDDGEGSLRPQTLREYIGQEKAKGNLEVFIQAAKMRSEPLDHVLLHGPPGLGKTTLSCIIANDNINGIVLHRWIQHFLHSPIEAVNFIHKQNIIFIEIGQ